MRTLNVLLGREASYRLATQGVYALATEKVVAAHLAIYDPARYATYDKATHIVVPVQQAIYDPKVFGRYDLASQQVVSKEAALGPDLNNLDIMMEEAQRLVKRGVVTLETDRYTQVLSLLGRGEGICLDACTAYPLDTTRTEVEARGYRYVPIDINGDGTTVGREDLRALSFADNSIARIISLDTLEHIDEYPAALAELYRVLAANGIAVFHVPCYYFDKERSVPIEPGTDPWEHVRYFAAKELVASLAEAGFIVLRIAMQLDYGALLCVVAKSEHAGADAMDAS